MADMQRLMDVVRQLESNGIDVIRLLESQAPVPMPSPMPQDGGMQPVPMPTSPGAVIDGMRPVPMPRTGSFTGPGPGAVITEQDMEMVRRRMMQDRMNRQDPMAGLLQMLGGR